MRKKVIFFFFGMVCSFSALAGEGEYAVANISPALLKNADQNGYKVNAYRTQPITFRVKSE
jgi:hypothetical protein